MNTSAWPFSGARYEFRKMIFALAGIFAKSAPSPQTSTRSVPSWYAGASAWNNSRAFAVFGFLSALISRSSSTRSPSSGSQSVLANEWNTSPR